MRISERGSTLVVRDTPGCVWVFGLWFIAGGAIALIMPFVAVNRDEVPGWAKLVAFLIGIAVVTAGGLVIRATPSTYTVIDSAAGRVRVTTRHFGGPARVEELALTDVALLQVLPGTDSDGDTNYSLRLLLKDGRAIPLHAQPAYGKDWIETRASRIRAFLGDRTAT